MGVGTSDARHGVYLPAIRSAELRYDGAMRKGIADAANRSIVRRNGWLISPGSCCALFVLDFHLNS